MPELRNRKGAMLVLVAILMIVLLGFSGIAIDASRLYVMRAQVQTTADAAAIAAIVEVNDTRPTNATAVALQYVPKNLVEQTTATVTAADVEPGSWDFASNVFTKLGSWTDPAVDAVRVTARYPGAYTFARVFGASGQTVTARAVGAIGYVNSSDCLRPWAVSYQTMLDQLYPPAGTKGPGYDLTPQDVETLAAMSYPSNTITLVQGNANTTTNGSIAQVQVNNPWIGNTAYTDAITGCSNRDIGPGTQLRGDPGSGGAQTMTALQTFCDLNGGTTPQGAAFSCNAQPKIRLVLWDRNNGASGAGLVVRVKYVGVFAIASVSAGASSTTQITGSFSTLAAPGSFSAKPSPITGSVGLVQ